ncbi:MAG: hypothetical protein ABI673_02485 [Novosphingobium sp.]
MAHKSRLTPTANWLETRRTPLCAAWLLLCLVLGGASNAGSLANLVLQFGAAGIIAWHILRGKMNSAGRDDVILLTLLGAGVAWIVLTLIPLPPALWIHLPGRGFVAEGYRLLGLDLPWLPISLTDDRTVRSALSLLVPVATYLVVRPLAIRQRAWLAVVVAGFAVLSTALGMAQLTGGENSPLRIYSITNRSDPVGLFANANHLATMLLVMMPLIAAALPIISDRPLRGGKRTARWTGSRLAWSPLAMLCVALFLSGLALIGSNAGLMLAVPSLAGALFLGPLQPMLAKPFVRRTLGLGVAAVMALAVAMIFTGQFQQKIGVSATSRQMVTGTTLHTAGEYMPVGTGLGSFSAIYLKHSGGEKSAREWMNHAHDDLAEVTLELGAPGVILMALFALWLLGRAWRVWLRDPRAEGLPLIRAASLGAVIVGLHSMADYPLRSAAIAALFAMLLALIVDRPTDQPADPSRADPFLGGPL